MKLIHFKLHLCLDYLFTLFLVLAIPIFDLEFQAKVASYGIAILYGILAVSTHISLSFFKLVPVASHKMIELFYLFLLFVIVFFFYRIEDYRSYNYFGSIALIEVIVWTVTDFKSNEG